VPPSENLSEPFCPVVVAPDDETAPATCLDCTLLPGSTLVKPDFWEE